MPLRPVLRHGRIISSRIQPAKRTTHLFLFDALQQKLHADQPVAESEVLFNILAPAVIEDHVTFGFTRKHGENSEFSFAVMYAFNNDVTGLKPLDPTQTITFAMQQWELEFGYSWRF